MPKKQRIEIIKMSKYIGFFDTKTKKRLENLYPTKMVTIKRKAKAYASGYTTYKIGDLHKKMMGRRTISMEEYKKLKKKYKRGK